MKIDELKQKRMEIIRIASGHGAKKVRVFGSLARGESGMHSDVDFLVEMEHGRTLLDIIAIKQDLEEFLQRKVDVITEAAISPYIRHEILNQAVSI